MILRQAPPMVSVIIPCFTNRRQAAFVDTWVAQTYSDDRYELVFVIRKGDSFLNEIESRKRPSDTVIITTASDVNELYLIGVNAAKGDLLFFSEDHVAAEPFCIEHLVNLAVTEQFAAATAVDRHINITKTGRMEELATDRDMAIWATPGAWDRVRLRGFAIWRDVYEDVGGLEPGYSFFSQTALAATLHASGYEIHLCSGPPLINHVNTFDLEEVGRNAESYAKRCRMYLASHDLTFCENYFAVSHHIASVVSSPGVAQWRRKAAVAKLRFQVARSERKALAAFDDYHQARREIGWRTVVPGSVDFTDPITIAESCKTDIPLARLFQLFPVEKHDGKTLRWSRPTTEFMLQFEARGAYDAVFDTGALRGHAAGLAVRASWNGRDLETGTSDADGRTISFRLNVADRGIGSLTTQVEPLRINASTGDRRELGIPICALAVQPS
jgi:Glycosyltransferase like family 2